LKRSFFNKLILGNIENKNYQEYFNDDLKDYRKYFSSKRAKNYDILDLPSGTVHCLTKQNFIYEIQQPSDVTYRIYDFERKENGIGRELHINQSRDVIKNISLNEIFKNHDPQKRFNHPYEMKDYGIMITNLKKESIVNFSSKYFLVATCISKSGRINSSNFNYLDTAIIFKQELENLKFFPNSKFIIS
jgi:mannose-6-phosphate isomerase